MTYATKYHYEKNKADYVERAARQRRELRAMIWDWKTVHPCVDCGEDDPVVLDFDHVRGQKKMNIGSYNAYGRKQLLEEIPKCEIRCANCHRRKTFAPVA